MLKVEGLRKTYAVEGGGVQAVQGVSFAVEKGEFFTLLGPSGCGKSTTLRCIAGLDIPDAGEISLGNKLLYSSRQRRQIPTFRRNISMVFQSYAIWPHMTVYDNVEFPLKIERAPGRKNQVLQTLELVGLKGLENRPATTLSGGQQQRVAIARAIVKEVDLLLFDEPLSNLDSKLRVQMRYELRHLQKQLGITSIYVTHDQEEALVLSDRVAVMNDGAIVEIGKCQEVYLSPKDLFTAIFVGQSNMFRTKKIRRESGLVKADTAIGEIAIMVDNERVLTEGFVMIRPEHVNLFLPKEALPSDNQNVFHGTIVSETFTGKLTEYSVQVGGQTIEVQMPVRIGYGHGVQVCIRLPPNHCILLPQRVPEG